ncbi:MAG: hypothetical protein R3F17_11125 [Planctomycetota bacterium]
MGTYSVPLNLYSDVSTQVAVMLFLNQPVLADSANVSPDRASEYLTTSSTSCRRSDRRLAGGQLRRIRLDRSLEPLGILPQGANLRVNLRQGRWT